MKVFYRLFIIIFFLSILVGVIAYARGYRVDFEKKTFTPTGILAISSWPKAAKIYINNELKGVTDTNLSLPPGSYKVEIRKEGYTSWSKSVTLKGELVISLDGLLFPNNPSLSPLTNLGIIKVVPIDQTEKILLFSDNNNAEKDGVYLFETNKKPLSFLPPLKLIIKKSEFPTDIIFKDTNIYVSSDYKQAIFETTPQNAYLSNKTAYLLSLEEENKKLFDITNSKDTFLEAWETDKQVLNVKILETYPKDIAKIASDSFRIISFSPDETKFVYSPNLNLSLPLVIEPPMISTNQTPEQRTVQKDSIYVYDRKEDKNYLLSSDSSSLISNNYFLWYSDSKHFVSIDTNGSRKGGISIMDYDGLNKQTIYSGPYENNFFTTTSEGKVIVLVNLNPEANLLPDLYLVGIK